MSGPQPNRRTLYAGRVVNLGLETVTLPNGHGVELEVVRHPGGAAVLALDADERICLVHQYRHAAGGWLWELPAGKLEPHEGPLETVKRELQEEAGLIAHEWAPLGQVITTPGFCDEVIHLFLARGLTSVEPQLEHHEVLEVHWLHQADVARWIHDGVLVDAKTIVALYRYLCHDLRSTAPRAASVEPRHRA